MQCVICQRAAFSQEAIAFMVERTFGTTQGMDNSEVALVGQEAELTRIERVVAD
jgi:hypothetical protein